MMPMIDSDVWLEDCVEGERGGGPGNNDTGGGANGGGGVLGGVFRDDMGLPSLKSFLEDDWYLATNNISNSVPHSHIASAPTTPNISNGGAQTNIHFSPHHLFEPLQSHGDIKEMVLYANPSQQESMLVPQRLDSSTSFSPSTIFDLDPSHPFFPQNTNTTLSSLLKSECSNPFEAGFDLSGSISSFLETTQMNSPPIIMNTSGSTGNGRGEIVELGGLGLNRQMGGLNLLHASQFQNTHLAPIPENEIITDDFNPALSFPGFDNSLFHSRSKILQPHDIHPPVGAQLTLIQKRAEALRQTAVVRDNPVLERGSNSLFSGMGNISQGSIVKFGLEMSEKWKGLIEKDEMEDGSFDGSEFNCDSDDDAIEENVNGEDDSNIKGVSELNNTGTMAPGGGRKGNKNGMPAKNLMAERRRRKKLNDRLYKLRTVVPRISKMDKASIISDAIDYLKELQQRINELHNELKSSPCGSPLPIPTSANFHPLTPALSTLPYRVKKELSLCALPSPNGQPAIVEVRVRDGGAINIHMFCMRKPRLLLSAMRVLDTLGIDIQQAVISCFNGFTLDVFRAEQCREGAHILPDEIKAALLRSAGLHGTI